jgi:ribosomal protein L35
MKLRTHKTTAKRLRVTGSGKVVFPTAAAQHLRHNKSKRQLVAAKGYKLMSKGMVSRHKSLVPYMKVAK